MNDDDQESNDLQVANGKIEVKVEEEVDLNDKKDEGAFDEKKEHTFDQQSIWSWIPPTNNCCSLQQVDRKTESIQKLLAANDTLDELSPPARITAPLVRSIGQHYHLLYPSSRATLDDAAAETLSALVEFRVRLVIQEAQKFCRNSVASGARGGVLTLSNVLAALDLLKISITGILGSLPFYMYSGLGALNPSLNTGEESYSLDILTPQIYTTANLKQQEDPIIDTATYALSKSSKLKLPTVTVFWVVVDGKVVASRYTSQMFEKSGNDKKEYKIELRVPTNLRPFKPPPSFELGRAFASLGVVSQATKVDHLISKEHLLLLSQLRKTLRDPLVNPMNEHSPSVSSALAAMSSSPGFSQILPYLIYFCTQQALSSNSSDSPPAAAGIRVLLRAMLALVRNTTVHIHLLIHQILQAMQFVVLHPLLGATTMTLADANDLRYLAAQCLSIVVHHLAAFGGGVVPQSVINIYGSILRDALAQPLPALLGAVIGVRCMGRRTIQAILLPLLPHLLELFKFTGGVTEFDSYEVITEIRRQILIELLGAISDSLGDKHSNYDDIGLLQSKSAIAQLLDLMGDSITPFLTAGLCRMEYEQDHLSLNV